MEFLLLWVLNGHFIESGLRYDEVGECYAAAQNIGSEMNYVGLAPPKFTCIPLKKGHEFKLNMAEQPASPFPF